MSARRILDRAVTPEWMSLALGFARSEDDPAHARELLEISLRDDIDSVSGRKKTVTALTRSWVAPDPGAEAVVDWAAVHASGDLRPWHIGVLLANFPFFSDACASIGRQLSLSETVSTVDLRVALKSRWGDRGIVDVSSWSAIRTLRSFGVLVPTKDDSISKRGDRVVVSPDLLSWLVHSSLVSRGEMEMDTRSAIGAPEFFMFDLPSHMSKQYPKLEMFTEGGGRVVARRKLDTCLPLVKPIQTSLDMGE